MNLVMLAYSYYLEPSTTNTRGDRRVTMATISFALAAIVGWPFAALLALPFVVEELFVKSGDEVVGEEVVFNWRIERVARLIKAVVCAAALAVSVACPAFDSMLTLYRFPSLHSTRGHTANRRFPRSTLSCTTCFPVKDPNYTARNPPRSTSPIYF